MGLKGHQQSQGQGQGVRPCSALVLGNVSLQAHDEEPGLLGGCWLL